MRRNAHFQSCDGHIVQLEQRARQSERASRCRPPAAWEARGHEHVPDALQDYKHVSLLQKRKTNKQKNPARLVQLGLYISSVDPGKAGV